MIFWFLSIGATAQKVKVKVNDFIPDCSSGLLISECELRRF
jgi:hypothetical protein